jgi:iron complex outermembrane receptor protein
VSARFNVALGDHDLRSISAYRQTSYINNTPANLLPVDEFAYVAYNLGRLKTEKISQEFHLISPQNQSVTYLLGLFYNRLEARQTQYQWIAALGKITPKAPVLVGGIGAEGNTSLFNAVNETMAAFGQVQVNLSDAFRVTLGARYTHDDNWQGLSYFNTDPVPIVGFTPIFVAINGPAAYPDGRAKGDNFSWRVAPELQIADNAMLYASYSTSYKPKGIAFVGGKYAPYQDETVEAWEAGLKSEWFGRRLRFNINAFRSEFTDFQATILTPVPDGLGGTLLATAIGNAGGLRSQGLEMTTQVRPVPALTLGLSGSYTDAKFTDYRYNQTTDYTDTRLPNSPRWAFTATADFDHSIGGNLRLKAHADYAWRDKYWTVVGQPDYSLVPSFGLANTRIAIADEDDRFEAGFYARNLFDTYFSTGWQVYGALGLLHYTSPNARRTAGVFFNTSF